MNDDKSERHHYTKHLSEFLFPFWSHELLLLWLLEFIAELLKPEMNSASTSTSTSTHLILKNLHPLLLPLTRLLLLHPQVVA